jgi:hypothetical protein
MACHSSEVIGTTEEGISVIAFELPALSFAITVAHIAQLPQTQHSLPINDSFPSCFALSQTKRNLGMSIVQKICKPFESFDEEKRVPTLNTVKRLGYPLYSRKSSPKSVVQEKRIC